MSVHHRGLARITAMLLAGGLTTCTAPAADAIVGGYNSTTSDFAFVAEVRNTAVGGLCTGTLVHPSWVLTAVHCSVPTSTGDMTVRVGNNTASSGGELRRISRILRHPSYAGGANDVALLELSSPITNVKPIPLAPASASYLWDGASAFGPFDDGFEVGWGGINTAGTLPSRLQWTGVRIGKPQADSVPGLKRLVVDRGPCQGDSGGPLIVTVNGTYMQAGVLKAANCGGSGWYSEVGAGSNRDWIVSQMTRIPYTSFGVKDWDRDGHQDLIVRQDGTGTLYLHAGQSRRGYSGAGVFVIGTGWNAYTPFGLADWDRDGHQDIVARQNDGGTDFWLYPGESRRSMSTTSRVQIGNGWAGYSAFGIADWDRDGHQDVITRHDASGLLYLFAGESRRGYTSGTRFQIGNGW